MKEQETKFRLRNNSLRSYGIAGKLCVAGCGNPTPPEAAKHGFAHQPMMELSAAEMFKSYRGIVAVMKQPTGTGKAAVEVLVDGVRDPLTPADLESWAAEYRTGLGWKTPATKADHAEEVERAMNRPEDPLEATVRREAEKRDAKLVETIVAVLEARAASRDAVHGHGSNHSKGSEPVTPATPVAPAERGRPRP